MNDVPQRWFEIDDDAISVDYVPLCDYGDADIAHTEYLRYLGTGLWRELWIGKVHGYWTDYAGRNLGETTRWAVLTHVNEAHKHPEQKPSSTPDTTATSSAIATAHGKLSPNGVNRVSLGVWVFVLWAASAVAVIITYLAAK